MQYKVESGGHDLCSVVEPKVTDHMSQVRCDGRQTGGDMTPLTVGVRQLCEHNFLNNQCCFALKIMREYSEKIWNLWIIIQQCFVKNGVSVGYEFDGHTQSGIPGSSKSLETVGNPANSGTDSVFDNSLVASNVVSLFDKLKAL